MMFGLREEFTYRKCQRCETLWLGDPPKDPSNYYGDEYYSMSSARIVSRSLLRQTAAWTLLRLPASWLDLLSMRVDIRPHFVRYLAGQNVRCDCKIADVGSGEGELIRRMARCGFNNLWGIDPHISNDRDDGPIKLRRGYLEDLDESFDVIMFNHSLEHVPDPLHTLIAARNSLKLHGSVVVRLPILGFAWERYGSDWVALDPPRHTFVPSLGGFRILAGRAGFQIERIFFDSTSLQFKGSERYLSDTPLLASDDNVPASVLSFERTNKAKWERLARQLNRAGRGDAAGFVLRVARER